MASPLARSLAQPVRAPPALSEGSCDEWVQAEALHLHQSAPGASLDRRTRSPPPLYCEDSFASLDAEALMSIEHYAQLEFLYADTEERAPSPFPTFASAPPAAAAPEMAADIAATPWEPATAAAAFQSIQDRPSALARLVGAGNTGRPPKSQAFPWNDPAVQERLYQLMGVCDAGQMTQAEAAKILRQEFSNNRVSHSTLSRRFAKMRQALRAP